MKCVPIGSTARAIATICSLWTAAHGQPPKTERVLIESTPLKIPAFEEEAQPGSAPRFFWRDLGIVASLKPGGDFTVRLPNGHEFRIGFPGANARSVPRGERPQPCRIFYYLGSAGHWHSRGRWERVRYTDIYPGVDLVLFTSAGQLEYNFEVRPGANPGRIAIRYGRAVVRLRSSGDLEIHARGEMIQQRLPSAFQGEGANRRAVPCHYRQTRGLVTFRLDNYDPRELLVIDPVLNFSTYLGGPYFDAIYAAGTDSSGNLYVAGETSSGSLPGGSLPPRSSRDAWVAKTNSAGTQLLYLVYLGGRGNDAARGLAVDASGNAYVTGVTASTDFPTTTGAFSTTNTGIQEAFVAKLDSTGQLKYSSYLGGGGSDVAFGIAVDATGAVYVAGQTGSASFPVTSGVFQRSMQGGLSDCFVSKLNAAGTALIYSTYVGGGALDLCAGIAIDSSGDAYVTGTTYSANFPTHLPIQNNLRGSANAFVAELNPAGSALIYSTFLGGSVLENGTAVAVDALGAAYVVGCTASPDFPITAGAEQTALQGALNGFVAKISGTGSLVYSTYIGGSASDTVTAIGIDSDGRAVIGGYTTSANFPVANPIQSAFDGGIDAFGAVVSANGGALVFSSFFGGSGDDRVYAVEALAPYGLFLAGMTTSSNFPAAAALQSSLAGNYDGFALKATYAIGQAFVPLTPCRVVDTRAIGGTGLAAAFGPPAIPALAARTFPLQTGDCNVPVTAQAYSLNLTVVPPAPLDFLTTWPAGQPQPAVSTLNDVSGTIVANAALVPAGSNGAIGVFVNKTSDVIIDINGYFAPPTATQALAFYPLLPCRVADTRLTNGPFGGPEMAAQETRSFAVRSTCNVPASAQAYSLNMTVVPPGYLAYLSVWPEGQPQPLVSTLNDLTGDIVANAAIVPAGSTGAVDVFVSNSSQVIIDINGYFAPPGSPGALYFYPLPPCRVVDTRNPNGTFGGPALSAGVPRDFPVSASNCSVPTTAQAYSVNMTVVPPGPVNYVTTWPTGQPQPLVSTLNDLRGNIVANAAIVPAGTNGSISIFAYTATDVLIDINGYFGP